MNRELLKQALDALENSIDAMRSEYREYVELFGRYTTRAVQIKRIGDDLAAHEDAIRAISEELAKPEPEPVAWIYLPHSELLWPNEVEASNPSELDEYMPLYAKEKTK
jgi:hypothetical protein